ncbi:type 4a pilus biogenesis protein PilO [Deferribacter thermophilus]|uniref:type 4a pilus biogenesis protein PilO n=1 Tax=Deferribacter thermophilus TaxID=53573 RepID=UPI003C1EFD14
MGFLSKIPLKFRIVIEVLVLIVIVVIYYFFSYKPQVEEINKLQKRYDTLALSVAKLRPVKLSYNKFKQELQIVEKQFETVLKILPNEKSYNVLYDEIVSLAENNGLRVTLFQPRGVRKIDDFHSAVVFSVNVEGDYLSLVNFIYRLNFMDKIININDINLNPTKDKEGNLILRSRINMNSYMFNVATSGARK